MEAKLARYRANKRKSYSNGSFSNTLNRVCSYLNSTGRYSSNMPSEYPEHSSDKETEKEMEQSSCEARMLVNCDSLEESKEVHNPLAMKWTILALKLAIWFTLIVIAVELEFGAVFFIFALFYFIWTNTRTKPKIDGEVSAYSVFNQNCEAIDGTLKAEQFERELLYRH